MKRLLTKSDREQKERKNLVGLWANLSRAYEIALLGNFSIKIVKDGWIAIFQKSANQKQMFKKKLNNFNSNYHVDNNLLRH